MHSYFISISKPSTTNNSVICNFNSVYVSKKFFEQRVDMLWILKSKKKIVLYSNAKAEFDSYFSSLFPIGWQTLMSDSINLAPTYAYVQWKLWILVQTVALHSRN